MEILRRWLDKIHWCNERWDIRHSGHLNSECRYKNVIREEKYNVLSRTVLKMICAAFKLECYWKAENGKPDLCDGQKYVFISDVIFNTVLDI